MSTHPTMRLTGHAVVLLLLVLSAPVSHASGSKPCSPSRGSCQADPTPSSAAAMQLSAAGQAALSAPQASTGGKSLKKSVTRFSSGAASLRQQVQQQRAATGQ